MSAGETGGPTVSDPSSPVWLITGCSSGFGRELVRVVLGHGCRVVATARNPDTLAEFASRPDVMATALDVTKPDRIIEVVAAAEARFGGIDVLVNNAGYLYYAAIEAGEPDEIRTIFETNFFGPLNLIRAALPGMRKRRRGHVVNISSIGGLIGMPGVSFYNAPKFALEGLTEALAYECVPFGVKATVVEPGPFKTEWATSSIRVGKVTIDDYADSVIDALEITEGPSGAGAAGDPVRAAEAIFSAVNSPAPPLHLVLGRWGYEAVKAKLKTFSDELDAWREVSVGADYPAEE